MSEKAENLKTAIEYFKDDRGRNPDLIVVDLETFGELCKTDLNVATRMLLDGIPVGISTAVDGWRVIE